MSSKGDSRSEGSAYDTNADRQGRGTAALTIESLSKAFPGTQALSDVSFSVGHGKVHGLLGGNGSGKSTLVKILAGVYQGEPGGRITLVGKAVAADAITPTLARDCGLRFVHQNPSVFETMTVAENMAIGNGFPTVFGRVRWRQLRERTRVLLRRYDIDAHPDDVIGDLRHAERTMVAIARALQDEDESRVSVLVLDEPTASLPEHEVNILLDAVRHYAAEGQTIVYVSHRIEEVLEITDSVTVLRDGRHVTTRSTADLTAKQLTEHIVGRPIDEVFPEKVDQPAHEIVLEVKGMRAGPLRDVSFAVKRGEIVGIAGLLGSGRTELLRAIFGSYPLDAGEIALDGKAVKIGSPRVA